MTQLQFKEDLFHIVATRRASYIYILQISQFLIPIIVQYISITDKPLKSTNCSESESAAHWYTVQLIVSLQVMGKSFMMKTSMG